VKRLDKFPLAAPGVPYLAGYGLLIAVALALGVWWLALPLILIWLFMAWFFRDPARQAQVPEEAVLSPADGKVVVIQEVDQPRLPGGRALLISVFMNVFDVHVNRAPISGRVLAVEMKQGGFVPADRFEATHSNHRVEVLLEDEQGRRILVTQVAGLVARRIHCHLAPGDTVKKGQRYGMIRFGSRLDVYLPPSARVSVSLGQRVKAGLSTLAEL